MNGKRPVFLFGFALAELFDCIFQQLDVLPIPDGGSQVMLDDRAFFSAPESAQQQDAAGDSRLPQADPLIWPGDAEPGGTFSFQGLCALGGTVTVSIGLHHRADCGVRSNKIQNGSEVVAQGG